MNPDIAKRPYRPCVGIALFNAQGQVFAGERLDNPGAWQMPQGGIDDGENIETAFFRELLEETGTDKAHILHISAPPVRYDLPPHLHHIWGGRFRGQEQTWVAARFDGTDVDININAHDPAEFARWQWVMPDDLLDLIVPFKRDVYREVFRRFNRFTRPR